MSRSNFVVGALLAALIPAAHAATAPQAATLEATRFLAGKPGETLLHITSPGRFALTTQSSTGTALSLVDMITGPTAQAGEPGARDGRLDLLLDTGIYKVRLAMAPGAAPSSTAQLMVTPFHDAAPPAVLPQQGETDARLADHEQRSFWFTVTTNQTVRLEAAGRTLADLRLWRDGRDLVALEPRIETIEPVRGHKLRDIRLAGTLPVGTYLATAYGGPPLVWADGDAALPFHIRIGVKDTLMPGWTAGSIGAFGSEIFRAPGSDDLVRLAMAGPATLLADDDAADIDVRSRVPEGQLNMAARADDHLVEVRGPQGAAFALRSMHIGQSTELSRPGTYWVSANTNGFGGDNVPATLILARRTAKGLAVIGSNAPEIGPGAIWHHRFNMGGPVSVLFHATAGGKLAASVTGLKIAIMRLTALDNASSYAPAGRDAAAVWDIPAGWYQLHIGSYENAQGVAEVTVGPQGESAPLALPGAPSPSITFGKQTIGTNDSIVLLSNEAPNALSGLQASALPVSLPTLALRQTAAAFRLSQAAGEATDIPIRAGLGTLTAMEFGRGSVPVTYQAATGIAHLPATDHTRMVALYWQSPPTRQPAPVPAPESARPIVRAGTPQFFNFASGQQRSFTLDAAQGGLFRVETSGRLRTRGAIGSRFVPELQAADANGVGQNMLLQGFLRAGRYHVDVIAENSTGHAGLTATPAPQQVAPALVPGATLRASLPAGTGWLVPLDITEKGSYRLDLLGLNRVFTARLEDAQGWPLAASGPFDTTTQDLAAGRYRLMVMPEAVDTHAVLRLTRIEKLKQLTGHGPHALPFAAPQDFTWREPAGRNDARQPDIWHFSLAAPADIDLSITDGMEATLRGADGKATAHIVGGTPFHGRLPEGEYRVEATSQGRNDRLDYTVRLDAAQLQPATPRQVSLPSSVTFALALPRVVSLTSFGGVPVRATLRDTAGHVLGRYGARANDWNVAISRLLDAGSYTVDLASAAPPKQHPTPANRNDGNTTAASPEAAETPDGGTANDADAAPSPDAPSPDAPSPDARAADAPAPDAPAPDAPSADAPANDAPSSDDIPRTEVTLALPETAPETTLTGDAATLPGGKVQHVPLPQPAAGQLILAGAASSAPVVLSLEQQTGSTWQSRALGEGLSPVLAVPEDASAGAWRVSVWAVDGGNLPIRVAARVLAQAAASGAPDLETVTLPGVSNSLAVAHVALPARTVLTLTGDTRNALAAPRPGHQAAKPDAGIIAPQAADLWLIAPQGAALTLTPQPSGAPVTLTLPQGAQAGLPAQRSVLTAWVADAQGQPSFLGPHGMGVADSSALALVSQNDSDAQARLLNTSDEDALRATARPVTLTMQSPQPADGPLAHTLQAASAVPVDLPSGPQTLRLDLAPGTAAIAGWPDAGAVTVWAGAAPVSRTLQGNFGRVLLVNTNATGSSISLATTAASINDALRPDAAFKRFFGAAGSVDLPVLAAPGQRLVVTGATAVFTDAQGRVLRGLCLALPGPGRVTLNHGAGPVAAWLEGPGAAPWPAPKPQAVSLPQTLALTGPAMQLDLAPTQPVLLRARSTAPVILAIGNARPALFPHGAAYSQYLPAGPAALDVIAPQDGPLTGSLDLSATPVRAAHEGLGDTVTLAPGDAVLFGFTLEAPARIGIGMRAQPDQAELALMDATGKQLASGAAMLRDLPAGSYVLQASVPAGAPTTLLQPAIVGLTKRPNGPPPETIDYYRQLAGLTSPKDRAP